VVARLDVAARCPIRLRKARRSSVLRSEQGERRESAFFPLEFGEDIAYNRRALRWASREVRAGSRSVACWRFGNTTEADACACSARMQSTLAVTDGQRCAKV